MKRVILAAAFIVAISGFAAAQSTSAKQATKPVKATVKKSVPAKSNTNTVLRHDDSAAAKSDSTVIKLTLPVPKISDTTALPTVKKDEEL